jgi:hypothetical protein
MRYKRLSLAELEALKHEFITFLVVQGIDASEWEKIKGSQSEKADSLIENFSDMVWDRIIQKVKYLETLDSQGIKLYHCDTDYLYMIGVYPENWEIGVNSIEDFIYLLRLEPEKFKIVRAYREYKSNDKMQDIFHLIQSEKAYVSQGELYQSLQEKLST